MMHRLLAAIVLLTSSPNRSPATLAVAFSPDGKILATHGFGPLQLSDAETGREIRRLVSARGGLGAALFTPDGKSLISYDGQEGGLALFPLTEKGPARPIASATPEVVNEHFAQAVSPDGTILATGGFDTRVKLWDLATGKRLRVLEGHPRSIYSVAFTHDGKSLVSIACEDGLRLWDVTTGKQTLFIAHTGDAVAVSPDGKFVAASGHPKLGTRVWELPTGKEIRRWDVGSGCVAFSPDGLSLAAGQGETIRIWEVATGKEGRTLTTDGQLHALAFRPDGKMLASAARGRDESGNDQGVFRTWNLSTGEIQYTLRPR